MSLFGTRLYDEVFGGILDGSTSPQKSGYGDDWVYWDNYGIPPGTAPTWALETFASLGAFSTHREFGIYGLNSRYWDPGAIWDENMASLEAWLTPAPPATSSNSGSGGGAGSKIGAAVGASVGGPVGGAIGGAIGSLFG